MKFVRKDEPVQVAFTRSEYPPILSRDSFFDRLDIIPAIESDKELKERACRSQKGFTNLLSIAGRSFDDKARQTGNELLRKISFLKSFSFVSPHWTL